MIKGLRNTLLFIALTLIICGIVAYFINPTKSDDTVDDKTNIENIVKNNNSNNEQIEGTVVAKRSTEETKGYVRL